MPMTRRQFSTALAASVPAAFAAKLISAASEIKRPDDRFLQTRLNADQIRIPIIFITAHGDERIRRQALRAGAADFLAKPFDDEVLLRSVRAALDP